MTQVLSDISGREGANTHSFSWGEVAYEIDLTESEFAEFYSQVEPYIEKGRRKTNGRRRSVRPSGTTAHEIRSWARANGIELSTRGRVPAKVVKQYQEATGSHAS